MIDEAQKQNYIKRRIEFEEKLASYGGEDRVVSSHELLEKLRKDGERKPYSSGYPTLDKIIGGFEEGELVVVSGRTGEGKTLFCQSLTDHFASKNVNCLWFSYEMPARQFLSRFPNLPLFYMPAALTSKSPNWIEERIWEGVVKYGVKIVFVDHLHYLIDLAMRANASLEIGSIVRRLKLMALRHNIIFFLIAHTMKIRSDDRRAQELELGDVRDSSFIEQEADTVLYIWRDRKKENISKLKIAKNRKIGIVDKKIELIFADRKLIEVSHEHEDTGIPN